MAEQAKEAVDKVAGGGEEEKKNEVGQMKRGDYMIHVFIEKARQLKVPEGQTVDPIIEVSCLNVRKFTSAKNDIGATGVVTWNEHLFFEPKNVDVETIEQAKVSIKLMDKGYFKDALIGAYDFDVTYIYFMKDHALMHKWLALSNPNSENFNEVAGYLKISITVATAGDEQVQITDDTGPESSEDAVLMPPSIRPEYYQLRFKFFRAEKLPSMDINLLGGAGSIDAYIQTTYLNKKLKTDVKLQREGGFVDWDQEFLNEQFFWKNIYGSPLGCSGENTNKMNENPEGASTWKGRILMQVQAFKTEKPQIMCANIVEEEKAAALPHLQEKEYDIIAEVGQGISLPWSEKFTVMIKVAEIELKTEKPITQENTYCRWNHRFKQQTLRLPYIDTEDIGRVYIYLMSGNNPICFYKADVEEFLSPDPQLKWLQLNPDLALGKVTDSHKAGLISVKISIHNKTKNGPINFEEYKAWKKPPPKRLNVYKIRAFIFQCRDLPAADSDGQSDPYIKIWDMSKDVKKTKIIEDNLNPLFYQCLELSLEGQSKESLPPFILDVYDWDFGPTEDDFIARCLIPIDKATYSEDSVIPKPTWHGCKLKPQAPDGGEILVSFSIVEDDYNYKIPLNYVDLKKEVNFQEFTISINILGLRDLQSVGILPVKKAFIVFNLKSLVPPDEGSTLANLKTQPSAAGANPTINTLIKFNLGLPTDPLFCPRLACTVHDYIFKGFSQPTIGAFIIPIGDLIQALKEERETETAAIENINNELEKILKDQGVVSYNVQEANIDNVDAISVRSEEKIKNEVLKAQVKAQDQMAKAPLLLNYNMFDDEEEKKSNKAPSLKQSEVQTPMKRSAIDLALSQSGKSKSKLKGAAALKAASFDKHGSGLKTELMAQAKEAKEKMQRELDDLRKRELEDLKRTGQKEAIKNILPPTYQLDTRLNVYREQSIPPASIFMGLGWDENPEAKTKHYRRYYPDELENIKEIMPVPTPFQQYYLKRGQSRGASKGFWPFGGHKEDDSGAVSTEQVVGKFKGIVEVQSEQDKINYIQRKTSLISELKIKLNLLSMKRTGNKVDLKLEKLDTMEGRQKFELEIEPLGISHLQITKHLADLESDETLKRLLMQQTKCIVRVYMINGYDLASRDNGGFSDPYLKITCNSKTYNERDHYQLDNPNPDFYQYYDFEGVFPGCSPLVIEAMDYDDIFGDDLIGSTSIDLEDRFFSVEWQSIKHKPIEYRQLYHPSSAVSQGVLKLWVEIHPTSLPPEAQPIIYKIAPKPPEEFEVRVVIFDTIDLKMMDEEGTSDAYFRCFFDSRQEVHETDTHYRCQDGKASFNYRLIYNIKNDRKEYNFTIQGYDRDFFKSNDIIGEALLDLRLPLEDCALSGRPLGLTKTYYNAYMKEKGIQLTYKDDNTFFVTLRGKDDKTGEITDNGKVRVQIDIYPKAMAEANKVGEARQEPNHSPFLPPPVGRISFSLNPLKMFQQLVGPALRRKIYCYCCLILCIFLTVMLVPLVAGNIISTLINKILGLQ